MVRFTGVIVVFYLVVAASWITNLVKLTRCDFVADYKCEVIHAIGIVPPMALVTAWLDTDANKKP